MVYRGTLLLGGFSKVPGMLYLKRDIDDQLEGWKDDPERTPLILRGARQVGKSSSIERLGLEFFDNLATVNFEQRPELAEAFQSLDPSQIVRQLEVALGEDIRPGKTLLFLDEVQNCPNAIVALRYFREQMPGLHVVAAGSLLEFSIQEEEISFPVGRVTFLYMRPLSFLEFLQAIGKKQALRAIRNASLANPPDEIVHRQLLQLLQEYLFVGGMPNVVRSFAQHGSFRRCQNEQEDIIETYRDDFGKYAKQAQFKYLKRLFERAPDLVGEHIKYSKIDSSLTTNPARDYKIALELLGKAGLVRQVYCTAANGLPLRSEMNHKKLKLILLDVGLYQRSLGVEPGSVQAAELVFCHNGRLTEQFVGQELIAYSEARRNRRLFFWERLKPSSTAEVDYVWPLANQAVPIEVKSGKTGRLRSLQTFLETKPASLGLRISEHGLALEGSILSVPLYMISELSRLYSEGLALAPYKTDS